MRRLGRGLASLIREVPAPAPEPITAPSTPTQEIALEDRTLLGSWPAEHPDALTPTPLRLSARNALEKLSVRSRLGLKAARVYLDHLRQIDGRTHVSLDLSGIDLTSATMLQLKRGRILSETRYQFFGVSIWK